ncbi:segregation and condensation protein A [Bacteroidota bacterium]
MSFEVKLPLFEGPFDLLLFFIERDELDIYDIPISKITEDFLSYIHRLEEMNIEVASEFILVAATLMRIKAKMLLPRPTLDEEGNEIDPREELVKHLLEYKKYKSVVSDFSSLEGDQFPKEKRGNISRELKKLAESSNVESELQDVDLYKLLKVFEKVVDRYVIEQNKPIHTVVQYPYTIAEQKEFIIRTLQKRKNMSFEEIISVNPSRMAVIYNFLAILELLQLKLATLVTGEGFNNFWIQLPEKEQATIK